MTNEDAGAEAVFQQALAWHRQGRIGEAKRLYGRTLTLQPQHAAALHLLGVIAAQANQIDQALELIGRSIRIHPQGAAAHHDHGLALSRLKRYEAAVDSFDRAIALDPNSAESHFSRGNALRDLKRHEAALASYDTAIALRGNYARAHNNRGNMLQELKQFAVAVASYDRAILLEPDAADPHINRGNALRMLKHNEAAVASYNQAIAIAPNNAAAYINRGLVLVQLKQYAAADLDIDRAIAINPNAAEAYANRGLLLAELKRYAEAVAQFTEAIALKPDYAKAYFNRGLAFAELKQIEAAIAEYDRAMSLGLELNGAHGLRLHAKSIICDWSNLGPDLKLLMQRLDRDEAASSPFCVLTLSGSSALQEKAARNWVREEFPGSAVLPAITKRGKPDKIHIGYFSPDLRDHPVSHLTAELFEIHDRSRFEITAFSLGPDTQDEMRKRMEVTFDRFIDVRAKSDQQIAMLARDMKIDVAIDLAGFTQECRPRIFAMRAAPLQVGYLGYSGTMGADYIDYLIADRTVVPEGIRQHFREKIIDLPDCYLPNDSTRLVADKVFTRQELGLPQDGFIFCCFNSSYKIRPNIFASWMRILKQVKGSVLWLSECHPRAMSNLQQEAANSNVRSERLIFASRLPSMPEHLARQRVADLFLDTLPYNAHTTASDALWAGLPVLTRIGEAFAGRVAASLLKAIRLPELITTTEAEYEELAVELAANPARLTEIKQRLACNRLAAPLFDTRQYTKQLEAAYIVIHERYHAGLPPEHLDVDALRTK